jgi:uncharacterized protein YlxP (DUF503 family)
MFVGVARIALQLPGARSLKDRRRVVKSLKERLRARLALSVAEIGETERPGSATLGLCIVSAERSACERSLDRAISSAYQLGDALVTDARREVLPFGQAGSEIRGGIEELLDRDAASDDIEENL